MAITDFRNLKEHGGASLSELKEFLSSLRGRSPQEVIGIVKTSLLIQSIAISAGLIVVFLGIFTITPYMIWGPQVAQKPKKTPPPEAAQAAATAPATVAAKAETKSDGSPSSEDTGKAMKAMGMDETKTADPKSNPLEKDFDKLLDGAK
jgi:hypothetical protein